MKELARFQATSGLARNAHIKSFSPELRTLGSELKELGNLDIHQLGGAKKTLIENCAVTLGVLGKIADTVYSIDGPSFAITQRGHSVQ